MVSMVSSANQPRFPRWATLGIFFVAFVLFFIAYCGKSWYVAPIENIVYPPDHALLDQVHFGLFWLCYQGHCKYDVRISYMIVQFLPTADLQFAYAHYQTATMAIETVAAILCIVTLALYFIYLANFSFSHYIGFAAGGCGILAGVAALIGVILFGKTYRGASVQLPFGWSFGLMIAVFILLIANGIVTILLTAGLHINLTRKKTNGGPESRPLAFGI